MNVFTTKIVIALITIFITIGSGIWLNRIGRPLNTVVFGLHKIISLITTLFFVLGIIQLLKYIQPDSRLTVMYISTGVSILATLISGGLLSFDKFGTPPVLLIHRLSSLLFVLLGGASLYFTSIIN